MKVDLSRPLPLHPYAYSASARNIGRWHSYIQLESSSPSSIERDSPNSLSIPPEHTQHANFMITVLFRAVPCSSYCCGAKSSRI